MHYFLHYHLDKYLLDNNAKIITCDYILNLIIIQ